MFYGFSIFHCMTQSLARGGPGLGTCMGPGTTEKLLRDAGFSGFRVLDVKSQVNLFYAATALSGGRKIRGRVDVADHAGIAHRNLHQTAFVRGEELARAFVAVGSDELLEEGSRDSDRVPAARAEVGRGERRARSDGITHRGDRARAHERHVGERDQIAVGLAGGARRAGEACPHSVGGVVAHHDLAAYSESASASRSDPGLHDRKSPRNHRMQVARGLHRDGHAVRQAMAELVGPEARRGPRGEQEPDDVQVAVLTSQADGSKRRSGLAAQEGSLTPWRTAVISARIATAISGGVLEPM